MLDTPDSIVKFKEYRSAGGLQKPSSYSFAVSCQEMAKKIHSSLVKSCDNTIDYASYEIQELPTLIANISYECVEASGSATSCIEYLNIAAQPDDLIQVSLGYDIHCKLNGITPSVVPSTLPIVEFAPLQDCIEVLRPIENKISDITALMKLINTALTPIPQPPGSTTPPAKPTLPGELKQQALTMISELRPLIGLVQTKSDIVKSWVLSAASNRDDNLASCNDAIQYTILDSYSKNVSISDAIQAISPISL